MNPVVISVLISGVGLVLGILYQIWARATAQGHDKQIVLGLEVQVAKLIDWNNDRISFQAGTSEHINTQKKWNDNMETKVGNNTQNIARLQGRDDRRDK